MESLKTYKIEYIKYLNEKMGLKGRKSYNLFNKFDKYRDRVINAHGLEEVHKIERNIVSK